MKLQCVLISFIFVNVVATISLNNYKKTVEYSNQVINIAYSTDNRNLENVILAVIFENTPIEKVIWMFAKPEKPVNLRNYKEYQKVEFKLQETFFRALHHITFTLQDNSDNNSLHLPTLGDARRDKTGEVTRNLLIEILDGIRGFDWANEHFSHMCRVIALHRSIIFPNLTIKGTAISYSGFCMLEYAGGYTRYYRYLNNDCGEINLDDPNSLNRTLRGQLEEWSRNVN